MLTSSHPDDGQLRYYTDETLTHCKGSLDLYDLLPSSLVVPSAIAHQHADDYHDFALLKKRLTFDVKVDAPSARTYVFCAASEVDHVSWCDQLRLLLRHGRAVGAGAAGHLD